MRKLLSADLARLWKEKSFWIGLLCQIGLGVIVVAAKYRDVVRYNDLEQLDDDLFFYVAVVGLCASVFCSLFSGTEYSDGTIRNKLVVGHLRSSIYLSGWLTELTAALLMAVAYLLPYCVLGTIFLEVPQASMSIILLYGLISLFTIVAYVSIFHMLSMLSARKSSATVVCILLFFAMLFLALMIYARLEEPEFTSGYSLSVNGVVEVVEPEPNPKYLQPAARAVHQFWLDVVPAGQSLQLLRMGADHPLGMMLYSVALSVITTVCGILAFRKKNLK